MNRRSFVSLVIMTGAGVVSAARLINDLSPKPYARLLNNEKGAWYTGNSKDGIACEGEASLLYQPEHLQGTALSHWEADIDNLVQDGYAEYL